MAVHEVLIVGGAVTVVAGAIVCAVIAERRRKRLLIAALQGLGLRSSLEDPSLGTAHAFSNLGPLTRLTRGPAGIAWQAEGEVGGRRITLVEHRYTVGSGKNRRTIYHTIAATPCPVAWPVLGVTHEHFFHKIAEFFGSKDIKVEDAAFNSRWRVKCESEDFAVLVLSPEVQAFFGRLPRGAWAEIGRGAICLVTQRRLNAESVGPLVQLTAEFGGLLPAELEAWRG